MPNYNHSHPKPEQQDPPAILGFGSGISFLELSKDKATYHLAELGEIYRAWRALAWHNIAKMQLQQHAARINMTQFR